MSVWEEELLSGATFERNATFTLALDKARQKLEKFQLPDPTFYILQVLQAIIASGAENVEVGHDFSEIQGRSVLTLKFDGPGYSADELRHLNDFLFESGRSRDKDRTREMALGIVSCLALKPISISLSSAGYSWERKNDKEQVVEVPRSDRNTFQVIRSGRAPETELLRSHTLACPIEMSLNDTHVCSPDSAIRGSCPWPNYAFQDGHFRGFFGIAYGQLEKSSLTLLRYGVQFTRRLESRIYPPLVVVCEHPELRKNASQSDIVEDSAYLKFIADLGRIQRDFSLRLAVDRVPPYQRELVQRYLLAYFEQFIPSNMIGLRVDALESDLQRICRIPLFTGTTGQRYTLEALLTAYSRDGSLFTSEKKRPRAHLDDVVVLAPSEWEHQLLTRIFDRLVPIDNNFDDLLTQIRARRQNSCLELPTMLYELAPPPWREIPFKLALPDAPLTEAVSLFFGHRDGLYEKMQLPGAAAGLGALLWTQEPITSKDKDLASLESLSEHICPHYAELYQSFWDHKLSKANRKPKFAGKIARATDHLANFLRYCCLKHPDEIPTALWNARFLEDRQGRLVSLDDIDTWLKVYPSLVLTLGGPAFDGDFALKSSPEICGLLQQRFGSEAILQATLENPYHQERELQTPLAGCADGPTLQRPREETEEEELERLKSEYQQAALSAPPASNPPAPSPPPLPPPEPSPRTPELPPAPEYIVTKDLPPAAPLPPEIEPIVELTQESAALPTIGEANPWAEYLREFHSVAKLVSVNFNTSVLAVAADYRSPILGKIYSSQDRLLNQPWDCAPPAVCGWLEGSLDEAVVGRALVQLYESLARKLESTRESENAAAMRKMLLQFLGQHPKYAVVRGPLTQAPLFTLRGGNFGSLVELRRAAAASGFVGYCYPSDSPPGGQQIVVLLMPPLTVDLLERLFGLPLRRLVAAKGTAQGGKDQLLKLVRRWLVDLSHIPETQLAPALTDGVGWGEPTRWFGGRKKYFVEHLENGATELNPAHTLMKSIVSLPDGPERMAPVLASSVYTAINRALHEIEDVHELRFLEALLDRL